MAQTQYNIAIMKSPFGGKGLSIEIILLRMGEVPSQLHFYSTLHTHYIHNIISANDLLFSIGTIVLLVLTLFIIDTVVSTGVGIVLGVAAEDIPE